MSNPAFKFDHVHIISNDPEASANWYVEMFGATITANTTARGAPQIFVDLGGMTILIRGQRPRLSGLAVVPLERQLKRVEIWWRLGFEETIQASAMHQIGADQSTSGRPPFQPPGTRASHPRTRPARGGGLGRGHWLTR